MVAVVLNREAEALDEEAMCSLEAEAEALCSLDLEFPAADSRAEHSCTYNVGATRIAKDP